MLQESQKYKIFLETKALSLTAICSVETSFKNKQPRLRFEKLPVIGLLHGFEQVLLSQTRRTPEIK